MTIFAGRIKETLLLAAILCFSAFIYAEDKTTSTPFPTGDQPKSSKKSKSKHVFKLGDDLNSSKKLDGRWNSMDNGPTMSSSFKTNHEFIRKAISVRLGEKKNSGIVFDSKNLGFKMGWDNGFLEFNSARFGLVNPPKATGTHQFSVPKGKVWKHSQLVFNGLYMQNQNVLFSYSVDGKQILETPSIHKLKNGLSVFSRTIKVSPSDKQLSQIVADNGYEVALTEVNQFVTVNHSKGQPVELVIKPHTKETQFTLLIVGKPREIVTPTEEQDRKQFIPLGEYVVSSKTPHINSIIKEIRDQNSNPQDLVSYKNPLEKRWGTPLETEGEVGKNNGPFAIDTINLPHDNRFNALFFVGDHDYFSKPGKFALCTVHGDVWIAKGVNEKLNKITWHRFATGLYQPLGLKIIDDFVYVLGRDQITRLHDTNNDGEADFYEAFAHNIPTSNGRHDFATCLETDPEGNFYYVNERGLQQVSKDGKTHTEIATGLRNPNSMSVSNTGIVTAAPQEGTWAPAGGVFELTPGGHYGYGGPKVTSERPLGFNVPLNWIPRELDNSTGSQVWIESKKWGPLEGALLNLSYGHCKMILMALEKRDETLNSNWPLIPSKVDISQIPIPDAQTYVQGASTSVPDLNFQSGIMRGCFSPHDGQMYLSGLRGWTTAAVRDGCFQRVRYTGKSLHMPVKIATLKNGIAMTFSGKLDKDSAEDPDSYFVEQWNYWYSKSYGSPEYKVSSSREEGRDPVDVLSATLIDENTVFLELSEVVPVMQMGINYNIEAADGTPLENICFHTINRIRDFEMDSGKLSKRKGKGQLPEEIVTQLQQGVHWEFSSENKTTTYHSRFPHLLSNEEHSEAKIAKGKFYLESPLKAESLFGLSGNTSHVSVKLNGESLFEINEPTLDLSKVTPIRVRLNKGYNSIEIEYQKPKNKNAEFKLLWGVDENRMESIAPDKIKYLPTEETQNYHLSFQGKELFARHQCIHCHQPGELTLKQPEFQIAAPQLTHTAERLNKEWIVEWLTDANRISNYHEMPSLLKKGERQEAADLAEFLFAQSKPSKNKDFQFAKAPVDDLIDNGEKLFENLGCITCHRFTEPSDEDPHFRRSLNYVKTKFTKAGLANFLKTPNAHQKFIRMPNFRLTNKEISGLIEYVYDEVDGEISEWALELKGNSSRGEKLFSSRGCVSCHTSSSASNKSQSIAIKDVTKGCLNPETTKENVPSYSFSTKSHTALQTFLANVSQASDAHQFNEAQLAQFFIKRLQCASCHDRDDSKSKRPLIMITEGSGKSPDPIPNLTWTGEKIEAEWTRKLIAGEIKKPIRNWLSGRMPAFPEYANYLAVGLAHQHGLPTETKSNKPKFDLKLLKKGDLVASKKGLDCRQCHGVGSIEPRGDKKTKIALGINFEIVAERLHYDFYRRFTLDPTRYDHSSKMPKLAPDGETTKATNIYNGDARKQFDAAWQYIHHFKKLESK